MSAAVKPGAEQEAPVYPPYYNPRSIAERFKVGEGPTAPFMPFRRGRFVPTSADEEDAVRRALRAYGPDKPDLWRGDDMPPRVCKRCGFTSGNSQAFDAHEAFDLH